MALHTKKQFADDCGITTRYLSVDIKRGNVIIQRVGDEDYIDDTNEQNAAYLQKKKELEQKRAAKKIIKAPPAEQLQIKEDPAPVLDEKAAAEKKQKEFTDTSIGLMALDKEKTTLANEKAREEIELLKMKKQRLQGEVIPTDLVKNVLKQHTKSISSSFRQAADNFLTRIASEKGISRTEMASYRGDMVAMINTAIEDSIKISMNGITQIIQEFSEKKGVGERE